MFIDLDYDQVSAPLVVRLTWLERKLAAVGLTRWALTVREARDYCLKEGTEE